METPGPRVTIERLACRISVPAGREGRGLARDRLARIAERDLPQACSDALAKLPDDGDAVYRIRRMEVDLWVDLQGLSETKIAQHWGRSLASALLHVTQRGGPRQVVRFDSARHFVAAFLRDLLDGRAWGQWYYDEFRPLQRLSSPALAVHLLTPRPDWIIPILTDLAASGHTTRLIEQWRADDIAQLWTALGFSPQPMLLPLATPDSPDMTDLAACWREVAHASVTSVEARARDRLRLWLALATARPAIARDPGWASLVHALVDLTALLRHEPNLVPVLLMETQLYPAMVQRIAAGPMADTIGWLTPLSATAAGRRIVARLTEIGRFKLGDAVTGTARSRVTRQRDKGHRVPDVALSSAVGSIFLLAPALAEMRLWERWQGELGEAMARRFLFTLALKALGRERAPLLLGDSVLAAFAGLEQPPAADARWPCEVDNPPGTWARGLPEVAARWYPAYERDLTVGTAREVHVLRDAACGCWLGAWPVDSSRDDARSILDRLDVAVDPGRVRWNLAEEERAALSAEAEHLQLGQKLGYPWLTRSRDAALSAAASLGLRRAAARLPGFAQASPSYMAQQFLAQPATLHPGAEALTVRLSGGPLVVVLRMAALPEAIDIPWLAQPLRLRLPAW